MNMFRKNILVTRNALLSANAYTIRTLPKHQKATTASIDLNCQPFKLYKLDTSPRTTVELTRADGLKMYKNMMAIRTMTSAIKELYKTGLIGGFCHLSTGQEASAAGMADAITDEDAVVTMYRTHGWAYLKHISFQGILSELTGRATGASRSKGGSSHIYSPKYHFYGGNSIVGIQVPIGAGIAFAYKYQLKQNVSLALYGDGTANQGQVFEAFNMAKLWDLPCIFVCENNGFARSMSTERSSANTKFYTRGDYIPGIWVDGMDVLAVREATRFAKEFALQHGPIVLEVFTYRFDGHSMRESTVTSEEQIEIDAIIANRDPINVLKERILDHSLAVNSELEKIDSDIEKDVKVAADKALTDPELPLEEIYQDVYIDQSGMAIRGCDFSLGIQNTPFTSIA